MHASRRRTGLPLVLAGLLAVTLTALPATAVRSEPGAYQLGVRGPTVTNTVLTRSYGDRSGDLIFNSPRRTFSPAARAAADIRAVRIWQQDRRDAFVEVTMRGALPRFRSARRDAWYVLVGMEPPDPTDQPVIQVFLAPGRPARISAWWSDGSLEGCRVPSIRSNQGRTYTVALPWRCSWYEVSKVTAESGLQTRAFMDAPGAFDRSVASARLSWDDDL